MYEGAVYMNQGKVYLVNKLDLSSKIAWCQPADLKYYTKTRDYTDVHVVGGTIVSKIPLFYILRTYQFLSLMSMLVKFPPGKQTDAITNLAVYLGVPWTDQ